MFWWWEERKTRVEFELGKKKIWTRYNAPEAKAQRGRVHPPTHQPVLA